LKKDWTCLIQTFDQIGSSGRYQIGWKHLLGKENRFGRKKHSWEKK
jgi:hypothetical protein